MASKRIVLSNVLPDIPNESYNTAAAQLWETYIPCLTTVLLHSTSEPQTHKVLYMIVPDMKKIWPTINAEYEGVSYVIYITCHDSTCKNCHKPGRVAKNCHTTAQSRIDSITYEDLAAGRRVTTPSTIYHTCTPCTNCLKHKKTDTHH
jgi:hypothetical protein